MVFRNCCTFKFFFLSRRQWHSNISTRLYPWSLMYLEVALVSSSNSFMGLSLFSFRQMTIMAIPTATMELKNCFRWTVKTIHWKSALPNTFLCVIHLMADVNFSFVRFPFQPLCCHLGGTFSLEFYVSLTILMAYFRCGP